MLCEEEDMAPGKKIIKRIGRPKKWATKKAAKKMAAKKKKK